jgi:hypothetical protein
MPKSRKRQLEQQTLRRLEEIKQRALERRLEVSELLLRYERTRRRLREIPIGQ